MSPAAVAVQVKGTSRGRCVNLPVSRWEWLAGAGSAAYIAQWSPKPPNAWIASVDTLWHGGGEERTARSVTLHPRPEKRIVDRVREIVRLDTAASARIDALIEFVADAGLEPPLPAEPLPVIDRDDVRLVCWMAVTPAFD